MRALLVLVLLAGGLWSFVSLSNLLGEMLPYPDPTPEMLVRQAAAIEFWTWSLAAGFLVGLLGAIGAYRAWRRARQWKPGRPVVAPTDSARDQSADRGRH